MSIRKPIRHITLRFNVGVTLIVTLLTVTMGACRSQELQSKPVHVNCDECVVQTLMNSDVYIQGEPITVTATARVLNNTSAEFDYDRYNLNFELHIIDEHGQIVPMTEEGITAMKHPRSSYVPGWGIFPNKPFQEIFRIDTWFEISEPGTYALTVKKRLWVQVGEPTESGQVEVIGDPVTFTLLP